LLFLVKRLTLCGMAKKKSPVSEYLSKIGRKGGSAKVPKGLALLSEEEREKIRAKSLATRRKNAGKKK
jgi:hypothetical protein